MTLLVAAVLFVQAETTWEQLSAKLLKDHPQDPAVLMLCLDRKDIDGHRRLAKLDPSPMVLSHAVNALLGQDDKAARRAEALAMTSLWAEKDPGNGYPLLILAGLRAEGGDLPAALALLEDAARGKWFRSYAVETRVAIRTMLKERRVTDIMALWHGSGHWRGSFELMSLHAIRILSCTAEEEDYRGRAAEAERRYTLLLEIGRRLTEDKAGDSVFSHTALSTAADALVQMSLIRRRPAEVARYAEFSRGASRFRQSMSKAVAASNRTDPLTKYLAESELDPIMMAFASPEKAKEFWRKLEAKLREKEAMVRTLLESGMELGENQRILRFLPEEDRKAIAVMKTPVDYLLEVQDALFPAKYGPEHRSRLVELATTRIEDNSDASDLIASTATQAILHHNDKEAAKSVGAYAQASLGDASADVVESLARDFNDANPENYRALARLGLKQYTGPLLEALKEAMKTQSLYQAIPAAYALRDFTGKDYGLDVTKWEAFAKEQPALFKK